MQQSSATHSLHLDFLGVVEDCCMLSILLAVPSCTYSFWQGVIPTSYFIFNDLLYVGDILVVAIAVMATVVLCFLVVTIIITHKEQTVYR